MKHQTILFLTLLIFWGVSELSSQSLSNRQLSHLKTPSVRKEIQIPDIPGYQTLKCDFHMHTIFSDGSVWPTIRVQEAWEEGLDAIAITDHIEHRPHREFVKGDHNSSYEIAKPLADKKDIILIRGGEITREMPPGHLNGLFLEDVNALDTPDPEDAVKAAVDQGGFVIWNHPGWKAQQPDTCKWMAMHQEWYEKGYIHGIEVFNEKEWYPISIDWAVKKELTITGFSDIHGVTSHYYDLENGHRPMTLIFATERSQKAIKEALLEKRSIAWFDNKMAGPAHLLEKLFKASVDISKTERMSGENRIYKIKNNADFPFQLQLDTGEEYKIRPLSESYLAIPEESKNVNVTNFFIGSEQTLSIQGFFSEQQQAILID